MRKTILRECWIWGFAPNISPGYHTYDHAAATFGTAWGTTLSTVAGKDLFQIIDAIDAGQIKALYVMGGDPLLYLPNRTRVMSALKKLELLIVQDLFMTDTASLAHIVLPAATGAEKAGSFTSIDNRVQCFTAATKPAGATRTDGDILLALYNLVAPKPIGSRTLDALHHEITALTGLYNESCDHEGCKMGRIKNRTTTSVYSALAPVVPAAASRPFALTVGPVLHHNGSVTTRSENNMLVAGEAYLEISGEDAAVIGVTTGDAVALSSDTGSVSLNARVTSRLQRGELFVPAHFAGTTITVLTGSAVFPQYVSLAKS